MIRQHSKRQSSQALAAIVGLAVGDALGVPVEFQSRDNLDRDPVTGMPAGGSHNQPAGTWSDDTSLTLCLMESLCERGINYEDQAQRFAGWLLRAEWTPHGDVFDVGNATRAAIYRLDAGIAPTEAGSKDEWSCGNGSLMRILPIALYMAHADPRKRIETSMTASRLTHGHIRCQLACALFGEVVSEIVRRRSISEALALAQTRIGALIDSRYSTESEHVQRMLLPGIEQLDRAEVSGSGYVVESFVASLWCALRANSFAEGVLAAVNLGLDTDTTGAIAGGLLGLRFGIEGIPAEWIEALARKDDIFSLAERFEKVCMHQWSLNR